MNALSAVRSPSPAAESEPIRLRVLSLGAGVQSTTIALMAAHGEIGPMPDCAIFADIRDTDPEAWLMRSISTRQSAPGSGAFTAKSICIVQPYRSTRLI